MPAVHADPGLHLATDRARRRIDKESRYRRKITAEGGDHGLGKRAIRTKRAPSSIERSDLVMAVQSLVGAVPDREWTSPEQVIERRYVCRHEARLILIKGG